MERTRELKPFDQISLSLFYALYLRYYLLYLLLLPLDLCSSAASAYSKEHWGKACSISISRPVPPLFSTRLLLSTLQPHSVSTIHSSIHRMSYAEKKEAHWITVAPSYTHCNPSPFAICNQQFSLPHYLTSPSVSRPTSHSPCLSLLETQPSSYACYPAHPSPSPFSFPTNPHPFDCCFQVTRLVFLINLVMYLLEKQFPLLYDALCLSPNLIALYFQCESRSTVQRRFKPQCRTPASRLCLFDGCWPKGDDASVDRFKGQAASHRHRSLV